MKIIRFILIKIISNEKGVLFEDFFLYIVGVDKYFVIKYISYLKQKTKSIQLKVFSKTFS